MDEVLIILICLAINALLAAYEMAFVSIPRAELRALSRSGNEHAKILIDLRESPERTLSIIQIGITMVGAIAAAVGGAGAGDTLEPYFIQNFSFSETSAEALSLLLVVLPITYLSVVVGELVPKTLALRNPVRIVLSGAPALFIADRVFSPVITALEWSTQKILKIFFPRSKSTQSNELTTIVIDSFSPVHQRIMLNMADIERKQIKDIMLPWAQVVVVDLSAIPDEVFQVVIHSGHTRLPVKDNGKIVGVLHTKEFIALRELGDTNWQFIIRPVVKIQATDSALGVMNPLQGKKNHMAIVLNQQGQRLGIVTLEDILEEVVGDIFDEDDDGRIRKVYAAKIKSRVIPAEK